MTHSQFVQFLEYKIRKLKKQIHRRVKKLEKEKGRLEQAKNHPRKGASYGQYSQETD